MSKSFGKIDSFPRKYRGVADCESFHGGEERKSGPEKGTHWESGENKVGCEEVRRRTKEKGLGATARAGEVGEGEKAARE